MPEASPNSTLRALTTPPRHLIFRRFLHEDVRAALLRHALANEAEFYQTRVGGKDVDLTRRRSKGTRDLGALRETVEERLRDLTPELIGALGVGNFEVSRVELELVAHGDGAFYHRHIDTFTGDGMSGLRDQRMISGVFYFHAIPKAFSGGELRLFPFVEGPPGEPGHVDIEPENNSLAVFPSWVAHEVREVRCPSGRFADSRFAMNCWICRGNPHAGPNA